MINTKTPETRENDSPEKNKMQTAGEIREMVLKEYTCGQCCRLCPFPGLKCIADTEERIRSF